MTSYQHDPESHGFNVGIAKSFGVTEAIIYNHIIYWLKQNASKGKNLHEGKFWMFETQEQIASFLDYLTEEQIKKAIVRLLNSGVLIKGNFNKNPFDKTNWYTIADQSIFQKYFTKAPYGAIDIAPGRDPHRHMAPSINNVQEEHIQEEQQQAAPVFAAVSFYKELKDIDISIHQKNEITRDYSIEDVKHGILWVKYNKKPLTKGLAAALKWACKHKPEIDFPKEDTETKNKAYAMKYDNMKNATSLVTVCNSYVEISNSGVNGSIAIDYKEKGFLDQFKNALRKNNFKIIEDS